MSEPALMDSNELAEYLGFSLRTIERMSTEDRLPGRRTPYGSSVRWARVIIDAWILAGCPHDIKEFEPPCTANRRHVPPRTAK